MALIQCPECGKEISDKARACIHCGYPLNAYEANETTKLYQLKIPMRFTYEKKPNGLKNLRWLLGEILGYTEDGIQAMEDDGYACIIAHGLTLTQALRIAQPFEDYDIVPSLYEENPLKFIPYN